MTPQQPSIPPGIVNLRDHEAYAQGHLDTQVYAYFGGGAGDEHTLRRNEEAWARWNLIPRHLKATAGGHTRMQLLGRTWSHPILLAPVAFQTMAHPHGELATAHAAAALGAGMVLSTQSGVSLEAVAQAIGNDPDRGPLWFQLYWQHDRRLALDLVQRAEAAGYEALALTIDAPCHGARDRERRAQFHLPPGIHAANLRHYPPPVERPLAPGQSALFDDLLHHAPTWDDVQWLQAHTCLPLVLKGVLHPADALIAASAGVAGLIVSNHGGRTLDTAIPTARALPTIAQAVGGRLPLLVDGGIRRGTDVLKALALGASAVLVGRPAVFALANAGATGVAHVLRLLRDELEIAMALTGCATLADITQAVLEGPHTGP